jgi:hypothetical protein
MRMWQEPSTFHNLFISSTEEVLGEFGVSRRKVGVGVIDRSLDGKSVLAYFTIPSRSKT